MTNCNHITLDELKLQNPVAVCEWIEIDKTTFIIYKESTLIIVHCDYNKIDAAARCQECSNKFLYYLIDDGTDFTVARDDMQKLRTNVYKDSVKQLAEIYIYSVLGFGTFIRHSSDEKGRFIIYCPDSEIKSAGWNHGTCLINGKVAVCGIMANGEIVLINAYGDIIKDAVVVHSEPENIYLYKLKNGAELSATKGNCDCQFKWVYTNPSAIT
jgi:hypothetical protein